MIGINKENYGFPKECTFAIVLFENWPGFYYTMEVHAGFHLAWKILRGGVVCTSLIYYIYVTLSHLRSKGVSVV